MHTAGKKPSVGKSHSHPQVIQTMHTENTRFPQSLSIYTQAPVRLAFSNLSTENRCTINKLCIKKSFNFFSSYLFHCLSSGRKLTWRYSFSTIAGLLKGGHSGPQRITR